MSEPQPQLVLLDADGQPLPALSGALLLQKEALHFCSCSTISGFTLSPTPAATWLRLYFHGVATTETWHSWLRAPQVPPQAAFQLAGQTLPERRLQLPLNRMFNSAAVPGEVCDGTIIELELPATSTLSTSWSLRFRPGPYCLAHVELATQPLPPPVQKLRPPAPWPSYLDVPPQPQPQLPAMGDSLAIQLQERALLQSTSEPTLQQVWQLALPFRGHALLGTVEKTISAQTWDGGILWPHWQGAYDRLWLRLHQPQAWQAASHRLHHGYLPVGQVELRSDTAHLTQLAFVDRTGALHIRQHAQQLQPSLVQTGTSALPLFQPSLFRCGLQKTENKSQTRATIYHAEPLTQTATQLRSESLTADLSLQHRALSYTADIRIDLASEAGVAQSSKLGFEAALADVKQEAEQFLKQGAWLELPDPHLQDLWRALLLQNRLFQRQGSLRYGLFPGVYNGGLFGVEEGWNIVAFAQYGHAALAADLLRNTFFDPEFLKKEGQHHQYRNGLCLTYARDVFALSHRVSRTPRDPAGTELTGNRELLTHLWPQLRESAEWIAQAFASTRVLDASGERPTHFGMMPRHTYGGDLTDPAFSFYGSSACWRGLRDAGLLAAALGKPEAARWLQEAQRVRSDLHICATRVLKQDGTPPFLPFRTDEPGLTPSARDYHQLFASLILETALFGWHGVHARSITDYLEATGRQVLGVARFDQWFERLGIDAEYSRGTQLCALHRRDFARFWLGLLGQVGLSCDPGTFVSPETALVLFTPTEYQDRMRTLAEQPTRFDSDPCSAGTAVMLQYLRYLLVFEERNEDDLATGGVWIAAGAPPSWFAPGQSFAARQLPTEFGPISLRCESTATTVTYHLETARPMALELFFFDATGRQKSTWARVSGLGTIVLSRG